VINRSNTEQVLFWRNILRGLHTSPKEIATLPGSSGLTHRVIAVGLDEPAKRLVIVSPEHDGRTAAIVQSDIQAAYTDYKVLTLRPAAVSVPKLARAIYRP
jgi:hypothetical protein